ncbi:hypothetical protein BT93_G1068 [Corymbia citriodora subsp. variegata]|nr:hypothetical protein BT93_G1068 [Corymbia citriodora subsp. variegata]
MSPVKLIKMARMWEKLAASGRRRTSHPGVNVELNSWHFVIYTTNGGRLMIPSQCLRSNIFEELVKMSEEKFDLSRDGPITVPCDAASMEYIVMLIQRHIATDIEKALLNSIAFTSCSMAASMHSKCGDQQVLFLGQ